MLPQNAFIYDFYNKYEDLASDRLSITDLRIAISLALFMFAAGIFSIGLFYPFMVYERAGITGVSLITGTAQSLPPKPYIKREGLF